MSINPLSPFELDGNAFHATAHDWDQVFDPNTYGSNGALATAFKTDSVNSTGDDIFQGGGSKDTNGIQQGPWLYTGSKPQGKDDITHAFAAAYTDPSNGHLLLYAGMDRFDNSGDSTAGFWFFANNIKENPNVTQNGGHPFSGGHENGDILLVSDFTVGGSTSNIKVFQWQGDDATGHLVALNNGNPIGGNTFAIVNSGSIPLPWSYTNKSGSNMPAAGEFLEEGVDLTALGLQGCFSTFMAETRSSQSPTATLSDFVLGSFPLCSLSAAPFTGTSKFDANLKQGDLVTYQLTVTNTGGMPLYIQSLTDTLLGNVVVNHTLQSPGASGVNPSVTGITSTFNFSQPLAPGASLTVDVTRPVQQTDPDPTTSTYTAIGTDDLAGLDDPITASSTTSVNLFQPSATLSVTASPTTTSTANQPITYTYTVTNTSSSDSPNLVLTTADDGSSPDPTTFTDSLLGNLEADAIHAYTGSSTATTASIPPGASFSFTETRNIQPTDPTTLTNTATVNFALAAASDGTTFPNIIPASGQSTVTLTPTLSAPGFTGLSKKGDPATYALTVTNTGPVNVYVQNVTESLLGNIVVNGVAKSPGDSGVNQYVTSIDASALAGHTPLAPGDSVTIYVTRTVQASDPDPTTSTVTFTGNTKSDFTGTQATITANDSVNLFQPSATLSVTASPTTAQNIGDTITYTYTVTNTSSSDSPNLVLTTADDGSSPDPTTFTDSLLGNLEADAIHAYTGSSTATTASIPPGASFQFTETRNIQAGDPSPLTNTATVHFALAQNLGNFSNIITAQGSSSVTLQPNLSITKVATDGVTTVHPGQTASFTITVTNSGAGPATGVYVTDPLPDASVLSWSATSSDWPSFSYSIDTSGVLTTNKITLAAGASASIIVSAPIPLNIFGNTSTGSGNGDPIPLNLFELDGNAKTGVLGTSGSQTTSHDWDQVYKDVTNMTATSGADASSFVTDQTNSRADDIFTGGGSKDTNGIQKGPWLFTDAKPQAKDDIAHAFAATYTDPTTNDVILYCGLDRYDNSGDSTAGFWFFQNSVADVGTAPPSGKLFTGAHQNGDILLVSDFTTGGSVSTIKVFQWQGDDATGKLVALNNGNPITGSTFAIVNGSNITMPWSFTDKSKTLNNQALPGEFLEEGVNLSALGLGGCFSNFMAETRSSQSPTATLSDFVIGNFNTCELLLPNTATVHADNFPDQTSQEVVITVKDADGTAAAPVGGGASTTSLTADPTQTAAGTSTNLTAATVAGSTPTSASTTINADPAIRPSSGMALSPSAVDALLASGDPSLYFPPTSDDGLPAPTQKKKPALVLL